MSKISNNLKEVQTKIRAAASQWNVDEKNIHLIAVSKVQPDDKIDAMLATGHRVYGENRVQEAQKRWTARRSKFDDLRLHLIGPLQTNKAADAVALFDEIHTVDRPKLVKALVKEMKAQDKKLICYIQVNTGEEDQKAGVLPNGLKDLLDCCNDEGLEVAGLMCIPPVDEPPAHHFALLQKLAQENGLTALSIGMSGDFEKAVPFLINGGAVFIRVGTSLFGARDY